VASPLQLAASVMALGKSGGHAGGDSPQASPPKAAAKHVARVGGYCQLFREVNLCQLPKVRGFAMSLCGDAWVVGGGR
jgi:hypothetical protein